MRGARATEPGGCVFRVDPPGEGLSSSMPHTILIVDDEAEHPPLRGRASLRRRGLRVTLEAADGMRQALEVRIEGEPPDLVLTRS